MPQFHEPAVKLVDSGLSLKILCGNLGGRICLQVWLATFGSQRQSPAIWGNCCQLGGALPQKMSTKHLTKIGKVWRAVARAPRTHTQPLHHAPILRVPLDLLQDGAARLLHRGIRGRQGPRRAALQGAVDGDAVAFGRRNRDLAELGPRVREAAAAVVAAHRTASSAPRMGRPRTRRQAPQTARASAAPPRARARRATPAPGSSRGSP